MNEELIIIHIVSEIIDSVTVTRRLSYKEENEFLDRTIKKAEDIVRRATVAGDFDPDTDTCAIFCVDPGTGTSHEVWAMGVQDEMA